MIFQIDVAFSYLEKVKEKGFIPTREVYEMMITQLLEKEATEEALGVYFEAKEKVLLQFIRRVV